MPTPLLQVSELAAAYGPAQVLWDVSLTVAAGEVVGVVGRNGAGKTTTLNAISGVVRRKSGSVRLNGSDLPKRPEQVARRGVVQVPEGRGLMPTLTARQNLRLGAVAVRKPFGATELQEVLSVFPAIEDSMGRHAGLLSGGQQQMVAIARGLVMKPAVLMVDELSLGLAPKVTADLLKMLRDLAHDREIGLLLVDQNVRALAGVCDTVYHLDTGRSARSEGYDESLVRTVYFGT